MTTPAWVSVIARYKIVILVALVGIVAVAGLIIYLNNLPKPLSSSDIPLKVGSTSITKEKYNTLASEGKEAGHSEKDINASVTDMLRSKEVARQMAIDVPGYLIAGQQDGGFYVPYEQMSDYAKATLYPQALSVLVNLKSQGGSIVTVYHLPYAKESPDKATYAQKSGMTIPESIQETNPTDDGIHGSALLSVLHDEAFNYQDGVNKSGVYAVTTDGKLLQAISGLALSKIAKDQAPAVPPVMVESLPEGFLGIIQPLARGKFSALTKTSNPEAYTLVYKDAIFSKEDGLQKRYEEIRQQLGSAQ